MLRASRPFTHVDVVEVHLWGAHIGSVTLAPAYGYDVFNYTPDFLRGGLEPAPLRMPLTEDGYLFTELPKAEMFERQRPLWMLD